MPCTLEGLSSPAFFASQQVEVANDLDLAAIFVFKQHGVPSTALSLGELDSGISGLSGAERGEDGRIEGDEKSNHDFLHKIVQNRTLDNTCVLSSLRFWVGVLDTY